MQAKQSVIDPNFPSATSTPVSQARPRAPRTVVHTKYRLPSDRVPFSVHFEILSRFVTHSRNGQEPIPAEKIEGGGVQKQAAQMNVKFLTSVGLLKFDSKGLYLPSQETIRFVNAKTVGDDRARPLLREILQPTWFAEIATSVLRQRPAVTEDALIGEFAIAAETNKERKGPALQVLVEYLVWSGIITRDERGVSLGNGLPGSSVEGSPTPSPTASVDFLSHSAAEKRPGVSPPPVSEVGAWHIVQTEDFFLKVRSDPDIIEDLRDQLALLSKKIERIRAKASLGSQSVETAEESTPSKT